jgi:hypothetical protein
MRSWLFITMFAVSACGGSGGGGQDKQPEPPQGPPPGGIVITVEVTALSEFEPNDSLAQAESQTMPVPGASADYVGFGVFGGVNDSIDAADYFLFTAHRDHVFTVQMCESFCDPVGQGQRIDTSVAYFEVLDQTGTLLMSSQGDISPGNYQEISITAGLVYYLVVFAEDTVSASEAYYVEAIEKLPFL